MSASHEWWEYHLTLAGWGKGSEKLDFGNFTKRPVPPDTVLTLKFIERMSSGFSPIDKSVNKTKGFLDVSKEELEKLYSKYGKVPLGYDEYLNLLD